MFALTLAALTALTAAPQLTAAERDSAFRSTGVRLLDPVELQPAPPAVQIVELPAQPSGSSLWVVTGAVSGALASAFLGQAAGRTYTSYNGFGRDRQLEGLLIGSVIGVTVGFVAGYFAKKGYLVAKIATVALLVFAHGAAAVNYGLEQDAKRNPPPGSGGGGWGW
jgi:hypothetical protein